ncbi:MAG: hypothetical protein BIFFINMI_04147 [Phycisphaerae bacterium]|nr:hypothetical protein [Phycisphaerae bacterium]
MAALIAIAVTLLLWDPPRALAWGPTTHIQFGQAVLSMLSPGAGAVAGLLYRHARDFLYGNVAADVIQAKKFVEAKKHCHNWSVGLGLLEHARDDHSRAFALGYLCHLAADCVAHNKFVPRQMTLTQSRTAFGHVYWEMRADAAMAPERWAEMRSVVTDHWPDHDRLMEERLHMPLFSFGWNKRVFTRVNLVSSARTWRRGVRMWDRVSRWPLPGEMLDAYHAECLSRMQSVLRQEADSPVTSEDPVGSVSFAAAHVTRKYLRQMERLGILRPEVLAETVAHLAPSDWPPGGNGDDPTGPEE